MILSMILDWSMMEPQSEGRTKVNTVLGRRIPENGRDRSEF